jgi:hypothetical protein
MPNSLQTAKDFVKPNTFKKGPGLLHLVHWIVGATWYENRCSVSLAQVSGRSIHFNRKVVTFCDHLSIAALFDSPNAQNQLPQKAAKSILKLL